MAVHCDDAIAGADELVLTFYRNEEREITYSWASLTSPVIAVKPRNGACGRTTFLRCIQSDQSSPKKYKVNIGIRFLEEVRTGFVLYFDLEIQITNKKMGSQGETNWTNIEEVAFHVCNFEFGCHVGPTEICLDCKSIEGSSRVRGERTEHPPILCLSPSFPTS